MDWYVVDKNYVAYLRSFDSKVGQVEYGDRLKLHIGIIVQIGDFKYYVPVSSPKQKHERMGNSLDFQKIVDQESGKLYAVININNMIPVPDEYITQLKYDQISNHRVFADDKERTDYIFLLQQEKSIIDGLDAVLKDKAKKLYEKFITNPDSSLARRCCDFTLLQEKSLEYNK